MNCVEISKDPERGGSHLSTLLSFLFRCTYVMWMWSFSVSLSFLEFQTRSGIKVLCMFSFLLSRSFSPLAITSSELRTGVMEASGA